MRRPSPIDDAQARAILDGYAADAQLLKDLRFWRAQMGISLQILTGIEAQARALNKQVLVRAAPSPARSPQQR